MDIKTRRSFLQFLAASPVLAYTQAGRLYADEMLDQLFHAPTDTPDQVDVGLLLDISDSIADLITSWPE